MNPDLSQILSEWPHEPGELQVRVIDAEPGQIYIQVRLDLGILQMVPEGRPDGLAPFGYPSLLEYHEDRLDSSAPTQAAAGHEPHAGADLADPDAETDLDPNSHLDLPPHLDPSLDPDLDPALDADAGTDGDPDAQANPDSAPQFSADTDDAGDPRHPFAAPGRRAASEFSGAPSPASGPADPTHPAPLDDADGATLGDGGDGGDPEHPEHPGRRDPRRPHDDRPTLTEDECRDLRDEAMQYHHRAIALLHLEDYQGVVRDTTRNLRVLDLLARFAQTEGDRDSMEPARASILMMRARALASQALQDNEPRMALFALDRGIDEVREVYVSRGAPAGEEPSEVRTLRAMRTDLARNMPSGTPELPPSQRAELRQRLRDAVARENYELAAILRDELNMLRD